MRTDKNLELMAEQVKQLTRIADSLESLATDFSDCLMLRGSGDRSIIVEQRKDLDVSV